MNLDGAQRPSCTAAGRGPCGSIFDGRNGMSQNSGWRECFCLLAKTLMDGTRAAGILAGATPVDTGSTADWPPKKKPTASAIRRGNSAVALR